MVDWDLLELSMAKDIYMKRITHDNARREWWDTYARGALDAAQTFVEVAKTEYEKKKRPIPQTEAQVRKLIREPEAGADEDPRDTWPSKEVYNNDLPLS